MKERITSIDFVRGLVMVIMALDHTRDFFTSFNSNPLDLDHTNAWLFFTRWITHFCAPTFVFLAGTGAFLYGLRGRTKKQLSWFLITRGFWLIILEVTLVRMGWLFMVTDYHLVFVQVIWALGWSMIVLAALVHLPLRVTAAFGIGMILIHNAFDTVAVDWTNPMGWLWAILHTGNALTPVEGLTILPFYPLIPWIGVMASGYAFGYFFTQSPEIRRKNFFRLGLTVIGVFIVLRAFNLYGDAQYWTLQRDYVFNVLSFLNCTKYPPSLLFLCMTLGPAILLLAIAEKWNGSISKFFIVFGRVPMFYYLLHIPLIHGMSVLLEQIRTGHAEYLVGYVFRNPPPADYGYSLWAVYGFWILAVLILYPLCKWYADLKARSKNPLLSYL